MKNLYSVRPVKDLQEWEVCFNAVGKPHLVQSRAYGEAKTQTAKCKISRMVFERRGTPVAICQVLEKRVAGLRVAARINRGPLFIDAVPSYETKENVYRLLRQQWKCLWGGALLIAPALDQSDENKDLLIKLGYKDRNIAGWRSALIDLQPDENNIRRSFTSTWRNRLQFSINSGLQLLASSSTESVEWIINKHKENMFEKKFIGPDSAFLKALHATKPCNFVVLKAVFEGAVVAGIAISRFGPSSECFVGWFGPEGRTRNCGNFLYWNAILHMRKVGCRWIDLGGYSSPDKYGHFKQNMNGEEYTLIGEWLAY